MRVVGICGRAGAGKDTIADRLVEQHGFVKRGFADALYEEVASAYGVTVEWLRNRDRKETPQPQLALQHCLDLGFVSLYPRESLGEPRSPRWTLQQWGTEYRRRQDSAYWVKKVAAFIDGYAGAVAVPDVRFANEAEMLRGKGATLWHVSRPGHEAVAANHESELGVSPMLGEPRLFNLSSVADLFRNVDTTVETHDLVQG